MIKISHSMNSQGNHVLRLEGRDQSDAAELDTIMTVMMGWKSRRGAYDGSLVGIVEAKPFPTESFEEQKSEKLV